MIADLFEALRQAPVINKIAATFFVSVLPVAELRVGIPFGVSLGLPHIVSMLASMAGSVTPVPFIILFVRRIIQWLRTKSSLIAGFIDKRGNKALANLERKKKIYNSTIIGLIVFVAIPLPGTGAWTGALIAALLDMRLKNAFLAIFAGVAAAAVLVTGITFGFSSIISAS